MAQPSFVPIPQGDQVRPAHALETPRRWRPGRPGDLVSPEIPRGRNFGDPGPDQGFAMRVARTFADKVVLAQGEDLQDVLVGCALLATRRSSVYGRAPAAPDLRWALELWGFLESSAPTELVAARTQAFASVAHHYVSQRALVDRIPPEVLGLTPEAVVARRQDWRELTGS